MYHTFYSFLIQHLESKNKHWNQTHSLSLNLAIRLCAGVLLSIFVAIFSHIFLKYFEKIVKHLKYSSMGRKYFRVC